MTRTPQDLADILYELSEQIADLSSEAALLRTADEQLDTARDTAAGVAESLREIARMWEHNVPALAQDLRCLARDLEKI